VDKSILRHVHFIGFRGEEYWSAVKVWGFPDFVHKWHDNRMYGDVGDNDILIFAGKSDPKEVSEYTWQDHEIW